MKLKAGQRLLFIGDSVTDRGRRRDTDTSPSEGLFEPLGTGYPHVVSGLLNAVYPDTLIRITNVGNSGNNVRHLRDRWQRDVLDLKPDWLSIMIGINDVWRQFDVPHMPEQHVLPDEYESILGKLVADTKPLLSGGMDGGRAEDTGISHIRFDRSSFTQFSIDLAIGAAACSLT
ncbi:MAG: hypothetical protein J6W67_06955 [Lentisphaeria bacterium]|nr:hypothetical protein [Lentisphaeria bacterium]